MNTVDLHGLQVKEALNVLKQVLTEKKSGNLFILIYHLILKN
jgi:DNA-nicking Smr family endonuclease